MDEKEKLTQLENLVSRVDFRIKALQKKRKDVTLEMMVEIIREANSGNPEEKIPECCGMPVEIFELSGKGRGDWVCHCKNCWEGTWSTSQQTRDAAIEAWERECV